MDIRGENKNSYFKIELNLYSETQSKSYKEIISDSIDLIEHSIGAEQNGSYKIYKTDNSHHIYIFKTKQRKRRGQLNKFCERFLPESDNLFYEARAISKNEISGTISKIRKSEEYTIHEEKEINKIIYNGPDTQIFKEKKNLYSWQLFIYKMIYDSSFKSADKKIHVPDQRTIISLVDIEGCTGKSAFFKWLFVENPNEVGRLSYGTASQLRSAAINQGPKKVYIIDLARAKGKCDNEVDLLAVIEELKSGFVISPMYGKTKLLVIEPPHLIISSNYLMSYELLSDDRWAVYSINKKTKKLGKKNDLLFKAKRRAKVKK
jgi:hypothetical protein